MKYREFNTITEKEILFICEEICGMKNVSYELYKDEVFAHGYDDEGYDELSFSQYELQGGNFFTKEFEERYFKYLFSLGMNDLLKDNEFLIKED